MSWAGPFSQNPREIRQKPQRIETQQLANTLMLGNTNNISLFGSLQMHLKAILQVCLCELQEPTLNDGERKELAEHMYRPLLPNQIITKTKAWTVCKQYNLQFTCSVYKHVKLCSGYNLWTGYKCSTIFSPSPWKKTLQDWLQIDLKYWLPLFFFYCCRPFLSSVIGYPVDTNILNLQVQYTLYIRSIKTRRWNRW